MVGRNEQKKSSFYYCYMCCIFVALFFLCSVLVSGLDNISSLNKQKSFLINLINSLNGLIGIIIMAFIYIIILTEIVCKN